MSLTVPAQRCSKRPPQPHVHPWFAPLAPPVLPPSPPKAVSSPVCPPIPQVDGFIADVTPVHLLYIYEYVCECVCVSYNILSRGLNKYYMIMTLFFKEICISIIDMMLRLLFDDLIIDIIGLI